MTKRTVFIFLIACALIIWIINLPRDYRQGKWRGWQGQAKEEAEYHLIAELTRRHGGQFLIKSQQKTPINWQNIDVVIVSHKNSTLDKNTLENFLQQGGIALIGIEYSLDKGLLLKEQKKHPTQKSDTLKWQNHKLYIAQNRYPCRKLQLIHKNAQKIAYESHRKNTNTCESISQWQIQKGQIYLFAFNPLTLWQAAPSYINAWEYYNTEDLPIFKADNIAFYNSLIPKGSTVILWDETETYHQSSYQTNTSLSTKTLPKHWHLWLISLLFILLLLWRFGKRFGPLIPEPEETMRTDWLRHFAATGNLIAQKQSANKLIEASRKRILQNKKPNHAELLQYAQKSKLPLERLQNALYATPKTAKEQLELMADLEKIRIALRR